uniref:Uncharacterized protein n=1 Tax=Zea mays TaxID=4577 RepID=B4FND6_MAIZE|nr:unknown [Zea mays]
MKSGPVLADKNVKYHEPEYWDLGRKEISTSVMLQGRYMPFRKIWRLISQSIGLSCTNTQTKTCRLDRGSSVWKLITSMKGTCAVELHQTVSGKGKLAMSA